MTDKNSKGEVDLSKVEYKTTEHAIELNDLEAKLSAEIGPSQGYSFASGVGNKLRTKLTENFTKLNQLTPPPETPEWLKFLKQMSGFFSLLLWFGAALCFLGFGLKKDLDNLYLGIVLSSVVLITGVFSYLQESKSSNLMKQFAALTAQKVLVRTGAEKTAEVPAAHLVRGDIVFMKGGVKVPADMRVVESVELKVSNAPLTGEADAIELKTGPEELATKPQDLTNWTFFGTDVEAGTGWGVVTAIGDDTYMGKVAQLTMNTKAEETPINKEIEHFIFIVSGVAIFLGVGFFVIGIFLGTDWITNLVFAIGIIVANVPEGLLATVTVCLSLTAKTMATKMVLVKNMEGVETLGSTTCICSDKTGTLTQNVMTFANLIYDMSIFCTELIEERTYAKANRDSPTFQAFLNCMKLNTTAFFDPADVEQRELFKHSSRAGAAPVISWKVQGDASEAAIVRFAQYMSFAEREEARLNNTDKMLAARRNVRAACEIPFNSALKYHMVIRQSGKNAEGEDVVNEHPESPYCVYMKGAAERILARCDHALLENVPVPLDDENNYRAVIDKHLNTMMAKGRRCLGFAYKRLPVADYPIGFEFDKRSASLNFPMGEAPLNAEGARHEGLIFVGIACLIDPPRPAVPTAVLSCQTAGIRVVMVTGDHPKTARAIARMVNIIGQDSLAYDEIEELNAEAGLVEGQEGWRNPLFAPAIVIPGWEISPNTSDERWRFIFSHDEIVFARTSPAQKLMIVKHFQELEAEIVAVTGDGVNDAPALKKADIGVAMNITGTDVAKGAADMILLDDNFASIVAGVEEGRLIFDNLKKSIAYTLSSNIPEISPFLCFITVRTPLPLSTVLILCIDLGTDMVPAISMAWEGPEADIMRRPPRNAAVDRLVTRKLVAFAYLQIGIIQAAAGFFTWMVVLNDYGYVPSVLAGLGSFDNWGKQILYCKVTGGQWRDLAGDATTKTGTAAIDAGFMFWDQGADGIVDACTFPTRNFQGSLENAIGALNTEDVATFYDAAANTGYTAGFDVPTRESIDALKADGYAEFLPYRARISPFFDQAWLSWDIKETGPPGMGPDVDPTLVFTVQNPVSWSIAGQTATADAGQGESAANDLLAASAVGTSDMFDKATAYQASVGNPDKYSMTTMMADGSIHMNIASRMMQKEALHHAQCAYFVSIVVVQWADLMICKTRWLSIRQQGMRNPAMNFGLVFETILAAFICYLPGVGDALGTRPIRLTHWAPAIPFSIAIFLYDETRKKLMREYSTEMRVGKQVLRDYGWLARQTYY